MFFGLQAATDHRGIGVNSRERAASHQASLALNILEVTRSRSPKTLLCSARFLSAQGLPRLPRALEATNTERERDGASRNVEVGLALASLQRQSVPYTANDAERYARAPRARRARSKAKRRAPRARLGARAATSSGRSARAGPTRTSRGTSSS